MKRHYGVNQPIGCTSALPQLQLAQVEERAETGPTGEACAQLSSTYEQQMRDLFMMFQ
jgi:hypothetical protein